MLTLTCISQGEIYEAENKDKGAVVLTEDLNHLKSVMVQHVQNCVKVSSQPSFLYIIFASKAPNVPVIYSALSEFLSKLFFIFWFVFFSVQSFTTFKEMTFVVC